MTTTAPHPTALATVTGVFAKWLELRDFRMLTAVIAAYAAWRAGGEGVWLGLVSPPASTKTEVIRTLTGLPGVYPLSSLTPQTFASGKTGNQARDPSLLRRLPAECVLVLKDFTTVLSMHRDARQEILAQLRELADGSYVKEFGNGKCVRWEGRMLFIKGVTPAIDTHWAVTQALGERFLMVRQRPSESLTVGTRAMANVGHDEEMRAELKTAMHGLLNSLDYPTLQDVELNLAFETRLPAVAAFVACARSAIFRDGYQREISYIPETESPARLVKQLATLVRGYAISDGRAVVSDADFEAVVQIGLDCIPADRRAVLAVLMEDTTLVETTAIASRSGYPYRSVLRILEDLAAVKVVTRRGTDKAAKWELSDQAQDYWRRVGVPEKSDRGGVGE